MPVRVLVVDDSAFARKVIREVLSSSPDIQVVGTARDGLDALEQVVDLKPDVVTLDLVMPNLDGVGFLRALPTAGAPRVVVVSMADSESDLGIAALQAGAVELVHKPTALAVARLYEISDELIRAVTAAAVARARHPSHPPPVAPATAPARSDKVVVIGASTGGPQALTKLLRALPADFPAPIAIALHMPVGYTQSLAERLDRECALRVVEASSGLPIDPGWIAIARAGWHLELTSEGRRCFARLNPNPREKLHRPSVDVLFESAARAFGARVVAVVLTGMGEDGLLGARAVRAAGGLVLSEAESSCVVFGMPRAVQEAGLSNQEVPLDGMLAAITQRL